MPELDSWTIVYPPNAAYTSPELGSFKVCGDIFYDRNREDGTKVMTSDISHVSECGGKIRDVDGNMFNLGEPLEHSSHLEIQQVFKSISLSKASA